MSPSSLPILVDCDGVIADFTKGVRILAMEIGLGLIQIGTWHFFDQYPGLEDELNDAIMYRSFIHNLPEIPGALDWFRQLENTYGQDRVYVCTSPWNEYWLDQRAQWLIERGIELKRHIYTKNKYLVPGYLIDDGEKNLNGYPEKGHPPRPADRGFMIAQPWNVPNGIHERGSHDDATRWLGRVVT